MHKYQTKKKQSYSSASSLNFKVYVQDESNEKKNSTIPNSEPLTTLFNTFLIDYEALSQKYPFIKNDKAALLSVAHYKSLVIVDNKEVDNA